MSGPFPGDYQFQGAAVRADAGERLAFLRRVYGFFTLSVLAAVAGALASLYLGTDTSRVVVTTGSGLTATVPPLVAFFANHWIIGGLLLIGSVLGASFVRYRPVINVAALLGMGFVSGLVLAPAIWLTQLLAKDGTTLTSSPVRDAFLLTAAGFVGLTSYGLLSRRSFSFLGGFLSMGLWVVIGASVLAIFVQSSVFHLAIASAGVLLFGGYILYDTARLRDRPEVRPDAVGAAISLYLSVLNLFLFLLQIFRGSRN
jgi:modulator of FtsH protease